MTTHLLAAPKRAVAQSSLSAENLLERAVAGIPGWVQSRFAVSNLEWSAKVEAAKLGLSGWRAEALRYLAEERFSASHQRLRSHLEDIERALAAAVAGPTSGETGARIERLLTAELLFADDASEGVGVADLTVEVTHRCLSRIEMGGSVREPDLHDLLELARLSPEEPAQLLFEPVRQQRLVRSTQHRHCIRFVTAASAMPAQAVFARLQALQVLVGSRQRTGNELFGVITDDLRLASAARERHYLVFGV